MTDYDSDPLEAIRFQVKKMQEGAAAWGRPVIEEGLVCISYGQAVRLLADLDARSKPEPEPDVEDTALMIGGVSEAVGYVRRVENNIGVVSWWYQFANRKPSQDDLAKAYIYHQYLEDGGTPGHPTNDRPCPL